MGKKRTFSIKITFQFILIITILILGIMLVKSIKKGIDSHEFQDGLGQLVDGANNIIDELDEHIDITYTPNGVNNEIDIQYIIDSAQNVIRDSIEKSYAMINFWSSYDTGLPSGEVIRMESYDATEFKLDDKVSSEYDYGVITIKKDDGTLTKETLNYEWFLAIKINDIIR